MGNMTANGYTLSFVAGVASSTLTVATFTDSDGNTSTTPYAGTLVNWGDGSSATTPTITWDGTKFLVQASHTYTNQGYYPVTVSIADTDGDSATVTSNAIVTHPSLTATNQLLSSAQNALTYSGAVAALSDQDQNTNSGSYQVQINWGDGGTSSGILTSTGSGNFSLSGAHLYSQNGTYTVTTYVADTDGSSAKVTGTLIMSQSGPLSGTGVTGLTGTEATALGSTNLATFTDSSGATSFTATIDWGDGSATSSGTISGSGPYTVSGNHTYAEDRFYPIHISIMDNSPGYSTEVVDPITIADAHLSASGTSLTATAGVPMLPTTVATFTDADTTAPATDYTAVVNWGDGSQPTTGIIAGSGGRYTVTNPHTYTTPATNKTP